MFVASGAPVPAFPTQEDYLARCEALALSETALACLEPERATADPAGCAAALDERRDEIEAFATWFAGQIRYEIPEGHRSSGVRTPATQIPGARP